MWSRFLVALPGPRGDATCAEADAPSCDLIPGTPTDARCVRCVGGAPCAPGGWCRVPRAGHDAAPAGADQRPDAAGCGRPPISSGGGAATSTLIPNARRSGSTTTTRRSPLSSFTDWNGRWGCDADQRRPADPVTMPRRGAAARTRTDRSTRRSDRWRWPPRRRRRAARSTHRRRLRARPAKSRSRRGCRPSTGRTCRRSRRGSRSSVGIETPRTGAPHDRSQRSSTSPHGSRNVRCTVADLDLAVYAPNGDIAAYGLFWADPVTGVGLVEPMRTEDAYQGRRPRPSRVDVRSRRPDRTRLLVAQGELPRRQRRRPSPLSRRRVQTGSDEPHLSSCAGDTATLVRDSVRSRVSPAVRAPPYSVGRLGGSLRPLNAKASGFKGPHRSKDLCVRRRMQ